jgi:AcrR family transcriptional regulator
LDIEYEAGPLNHDSDGPTHLSGDGRRYPSAMAGRVEPGVAGDDEAAPRRMGRPPMIDREAIVTAVQEIGLEDVTMRRVAERLGVSVPGLYHHVKGRDDLLRMAAERTMADIRLPEDHGQTWDDWLREWGRYVHEAMSAEPELVRQYVAGAIPIERVIDSVGLVLDVLVDRGFEPELAMAAWQAVSSLALGFAIEEIRERAAGESDGAWADRIERSLEHRDADALPTLRQLVHGRHEWARSRDFDRLLTPLLAGIAAETGR